MPDVLMMLLKSIVTWRLKVTPASPLPHLRYILVFQKLNSTLAVVFSYCNQMLIDELIFSETTASMAKSYTRILV